MFELVHNSLRNLEELLENLNVVQLAYLNKSFDFENDFEVLIENILAYFKSTGNNALESDILNKKGLYNTVKMGFNPVLLEKILHGRRLILRGYAFHCLEAFQGILYKEHEKVKLKLENAEEDIAIWVINLYQNDLIKPESLTDLVKIKAFWSQLIRQNTTASAFHKKLRLYLIDEDIYLLLDKIITKIR